MNAPLALAGTPRTLDHRGRRDTARLSQSPLRDSKRARSRHGGHGAQARGRLRQERAELARPSGRRSTCGVPSPLRADTESHGWRLRAVRARETRPRQAFTGFPGTEALAAGVICYKPWTGTALPKVLMTAMSAASRANHSPSLRLAWNIL